MIGGVARGRRLQVPAGGATRPTADRAREGLFSSLQSLLDLEGARVLDLYAGSGALGLEALSRGAATAVLVEDDPHALRAVRTNVVAVGLPGAVVHEGTVEAFLSGAAALPGASVDRFDLALLDPPYDEDVQPALLALPAWLVQGGVVVAERRTRGPAPVWPHGLEGVRERRYGEATLWYGRRS